MRFPPLFLVPDYGEGDHRASSVLDGALDDTAADDTGTSSDPDFRHYTDEQLIEERERRMQAQAEPTRIGGGPPDERGRTSGDDRLDQITDELVRRARLRHPSARGRAV